MRIEGIPEGKAVIAVLGKEGDTKYIWDPKNPEEVKAAKEHFDSMRAKGFLVFKLRAWFKTKEVTEFEPTDKRYAYVPPTQTKTVLATEFDPDATQYIATRVVCGG